MMTKVGSKGSAWKLGVAGSKLLSDIRKRKKHLLKIEIFRLFRSADCGRRQSSLWAMKHWDLIDLITILSLEEMLQSVIFFF